MPSAFLDLCEQRSVNPSTWRNILRTPVMPKKCLLDMTDDELEDHYMLVEERAENTQEDRALIVLEGAHEGRLERQAVKAFSRNCDPKGNIEAEQVPDMLEELRYELSNTELHYLLRKCGCTEDFDMIPEALLTRRQWLWVVGECEMLKLSYSYISQEAFEVCYEAMIQNNKVQREAEADDDAGWQSQAFAGSHASTAPQRGGGLQPEVEKELMQQVLSERAAAAKSWPAPGTD